MKNVFTTTITVLLAAACSCGAARSTATKPDHGATASQDACAAFLTTTQRLMQAVLEKLPHVYSAMAGEVVRIQEVKTNVYEVWVLQEERTDVVTFETTMSPECRATAVLVAERVASSRER